MFQTLKTTIARCEATLLPDALGAAALAIILMAGLHLPALV
ncbi:hypothetical protein R3X27_02325 [Tropicimonas sp. TH_r6]|nr:hypothetical protein [Tropicimonas sp. TH_r6]MDV7141510.1 hypothetical protein [Tropicimonas sp. TH_r6]